MDGWSRASSPFHEGEQAAQARVGVRDRIEKQGLRVIREFMPDQHRQFYAQLPFLVVGTVDTSGCPWASLVVGEPGFITSPDERTLRVQALPLPGDPLQQTLKPDGDVGILGIDLGTRRRNRINGLITQVDQRGFSVAVRQAFGNCPMYIQKRQIQILPSPREDALDPVYPSPCLEGPLQEQITAADTLFIATCYSSSREHVTYGADVSHRGGKPGFVRVDDERTLTFPDFAGNLHFNTVGNLMLNPQVGLVFPDFQTGNLVTLTGEAQILWDGEEVQAFEGAERLFRIHIKEVRYLKGLLPLRAELEEYSPVLDNTGSWSEAAQRLEAQTLNHCYRPFQVVRVERESETLHSVYLQPADDLTLVGYQAGQFLPLRLTRSEEAEPIVVNFPLSEASGQEYYRITLERETAQALGLDSTPVEPTIEAMAPQGSFTLDSSRRPVVLLSAGAGIAPMIAILNQITKQVDCCGIDRVAWFFHQARHSQDLPFAELIRCADRYYGNVHVVRVFSQPLSTDQVGETHDREGQINLDLLRDTLPLDDYTFYMCGPPAFTAALEQDLQILNIPDYRQLRWDLGSA